MKKNAKKYDRGQNDGGAFKKTLALCVLSLVFSALSSVTGNIFGIVCTLIASVFAAGALYLSPSYLPLLAAPLAYIIELLVVLDPIIALGSLEFIAVGFVLARSLKKKCTRVSIICRVTTVLAIAEAAMFLYTLYLSLGSLDGETVRAFINEMHTLCTDTIYNMLILPLGLGEIYTYEVTANTVTYSFVLFPATFITIYNLLSYLIVVLSYKVCRIAAKADTIPEESRYFKMSRASAFIYLAAYIITAVSSVSELLSSTGGYISVFDAVLDNLVIILTPGLTFIGVTDYIKRFKENPGALQSFIGVGMFILFFTNISLFFCFASLGGVAATFKKKKKDSGGHYAP